MSDPQVAADNVRAMLTENLGRVRKANSDYFDMLERGLSSSQLPIAGQAKQFCDHMRRQTAATFDLCDRLIQAKDVPDVIRIQSEFFQDQMRALMEQARSMGESAMKATAGVFTPKS
jgi:phasin